MKKIIAVILTVLISLAAAFTVGYRSSIQKQITDHMRLCEHRLFSALEDARYRDLSDPNIVESVISHVSAAAAYCNDLALTVQLSDLETWLIYTYEYDPTQPELLVSRLTEIHSQIPTE